MAPTLAIFNLGGGELLVLGLGCFGLIVVVALVVVIVVFSKRKPPPPAT